MNVTSVKSLINKLSDGTITREAFGAEMMQHGLDFMTCSSVVYAIEAGQAASDVCATLEEKGILPKSEAAKSSAKSRFAKSSAKSSAKEPAKKSSAKEPAKKSSAKKSSAKEPAKEPAKKSETKSKEVFTAKGFELEECGRYFLGDTTMDGIQIVANEENEVWAFKVGKSYNFVRIGHMQTILAHCEEIRELLEEMRE